MRVPDKENDDMLSSTIEELESKIKRCQKNRSMVLNRTTSQLRFKNEMKVNKTELVRKQEEEHLAKLFLDLQLKDQKRLNGIEKEYYFRKDVFDDHMDAQKEH